MELLDTQKCLYRAKLHRKGRSGRQITHWHNAVEFHASSDTRRDITFFFVPALHTYAPPLFRSPDLAAQIQLDGYLICPLESPRGTYSKVLPGQCFHASFGDSILLPTESESTGSNMHPQRRSVREGRGPAARTESRFFKRRRRRERPVIL